jgi:hypothetical protein
MLRNKYIGDRPFCALTGNRPNIGKTLACKVLSVIAEGKSTETMTYSSNQEELEKQVASRVDKRDVLIVDNVRSQQPIASAVIERMVTDALISFRRLGQTTTITRPNTIILMVTMNRAQFNQDLITRALPIEFYLDETKDPKEHKFPHESLERFVQENRTGLLQELCGMIEVWKEKGRPLCRKDFRFRNWTREIGGILEANGFTAFLDNLESATAEYDQTSHEIGRLFEEVGVGRPKSADELGQVCAQLNLFPEIRAHSRRAATALSNLLAKHSGRKIPLPDASFALLKEGYHPSHKVKTYTAVPVASGNHGQAPSPGTPGTPGTSSDPGENAGEDKNRGREEFHSSEDLPNPDSVSGVPGPGKEPDAPQKSDEPNVPHGPANDLEW